jgi:hypothetical protein
MLKRIALIMVGALLAGSVIADNHLKPLPSICPPQTALMRRLALQGVFDVTPSINTLIVNVIDGKLPQVRQQLSVMPATDAVRWRQSALIIAAYAQNPAIVEALLHDGAAINGQGWIPRLNRSFHDQAIEAVQKDPNWETNPTMAFDAHPDAGAVLAFQGSLDGPALSIGAECGDAVMINALLSHHPDIDAKPAPNVVNPLGFAIATSNKTIARLLLDRGANPDDALRLATALGHADMAELLLNHGADPCRANLKVRTPGATLVSIGNKKGLPDALLRRLACPAVATTH